MASQETREITVQIDTDRDDRVTLCNNEVSKFLLW